VLWQLSTRESEAELARQSARTEAEAWHIARDKAIRGFVVQAIEKGDERVYSEIDIADHLKRTD
jgi:hypothetical protein